MNRGNGDAERRANGDAERRANGDAQRRANGDIERRANGDAERRANGDAERRANGDAERRANGDRERRANGDAERRANGSARPPTILVVDDEPAIRVLIDAALDGAGFHVIEAADGYAALEAARHGQPDLVLLDIGLPGLSGLEVCRRLRDDPKTAGTPVLFLTGLGREAEEEAAATVGAQGVITKPFNPTSLVEQIAGKLRRPAPALQS